MIPLIGTPRIGELELPKGADPVDVIFPLDPSALDSAANGEDGGGEDGGGDGGGGDGGKVPSLARVTESPMALARAAVP